MIHFLSFFSPSFSLLFSFRTHRLHLRGTNVHQDTGRRGKGCAQTRNQLLQVEMCDTFDQLCLRRRKERARERERKKAPARPVLTSPPPSFSPSFCGVLFVIFFPFFSRSLLTLTSEMSPSLSLSLSPALAHSHRCLTLSRVTCMQRFCRFSRSSCCCCCSH